LVTSEVQSAGSLLPALPDSFSASTTRVLINDAMRLNKGAGQLPHRLFPATLHASEGDGGSVMEAHFTSSAQS
jgi:hypothetical protein